MVRTLHIICLICAAAVCAVVIPVLIFGFSPCLEIQNQLSQVSVIEEVKKNSRNPAPRDDKEPPLVVQARAFALRIDPPLPPVIITPSPPTPDQESQVVEKIPKIDESLPVQPKHIQLIGTASYIDHPEKSLALLALVSGEYKWVRQGEIINQSMIGEITNGRIILYQNGKKEKDLFVPKPQSSFKSLLSD